MINIHCQNSYFRNLGQLDPKKWLSSIRSQRYVETGILSEACASDAGARINLHTCVKDVAPFAAHVIRRHVEGSLRLHSLSLLCVRCGPNQFLWCCVYVTTESLSGVFGPYLLSRSHFCFLPKTLALQN